MLAASRILDVTPAVSSLAVGHGRDGARLLADHGCRPSPCARHTARLRFLLGDLVRVRVRDLVPVALADRVRVRVRVREGVGVVSGKGDLDADAGGRVRDGLAAALDGDGVRVVLGDGVPVTLPVALDDGVPVTDALPVALGDGVPVGEPVALDDGVPVREPVALDDGVPVADALPVALDDGVPALVALIEPLPVELRVLLAPPEATAARGVPDGLRSDARSRPRYVSRATASSPPAAASHSTDSSTPL